MVDGGSFAGDGSLGDPARRASTVTLAGIFLAGSLIGLIASGVDQQIEELRKGRSAVIESDHTLILGWSARVPAVVSELVIANASRKTCRDRRLRRPTTRPTMEESLRDRIDDFQTHQAGVPQRRSG